MIQKKEKLYEGKAKILYKTQDPETYIQYFKDDLTAFNAKKKGTGENKGIFNNKITTLIFKYLETQGIPTHYKETLSDREMVIRALTIFPVEVVVRNRVAGSLAKRLGLEEGTALQHPILEFFYKSDVLDDPMISETTPVALGWMTEKEVEAVKALTWKINQAMISFFDERGIQLIDFKIEFGKDSKGDIYLADEITLDSCRLWEKGTNEKLDKDRFRRDLGDVMGAYKKVEALLQKGKI